MVMYVTPVEFKEVWEVWSGVSAISDADAVAWMERHYGCERFTEYRVVVLRDVQAIPWFSWNVQRFEPDVGQKYPDGYPAQWRDDYDPNAWPVVRQRLKEYA
jgi:hypothetical protein